MFVFDKINISIRKNRCKKKFRKTVLVSAKSTYLFGHMVWDYGALPVNLTYQ
jgi:hypothetical protein